MGTPSSPSGKRDRRAGILVATLGVEPQVVTISLDVLLSGGWTISEAVVIYTKTPRVQEALRIIEGEFQKAAYPGVQLRAVPVASAAGTVGDFCTGEELHGLLRTLYMEIRRVRQSGNVVHLCISGGRKVMGIMGMVVAQLLFGPEDCVWHLVTEGWQPGAGRHLHLPPGKGVWLVPVPVLRWSEAGVLMQTVAELNDPAEVVAWHEKISRTIQVKRQREFIERWLTRAEREVVRLACRGLDNAAIAAALFKQEQTVANQLRGVYEKLREWLGYPAGNGTLRINRSFCALFYSGGGTMKVKVINFAHPLTESNLQEIETLAGCEVSEVIEVPSQIDPARPLEPQIACRLEDMGLTAQEWQTQPLLVNLPSLTCSAAVVLALLHGRTGYFPPVLRLRPETGSLVPRFVVAEILNLQAIRERGRGMR